MEHKETINLTQKDVPDGESTRSVFSDAANKVLTRGILGVGLSSGLLGILTGCAHLASKVGGITNDSERMLYWLPPYDAYLPFSLLRSPRYDKRRVVLPPSALTCLVHYEHGRFQ